MKTVNGKIRTGNDLIAVHLNDGYVRYVEVDSGGNVTIADVEQAKNDAFSVDEGGGIAKTRRVKLAIPNRAGAAGRIARDAADAVVEDEDEAWYLRRSSEWEAKTGKMSNQHARVYVKETGEIIDLPGPNCCVFCGEVWVESHMEQWACAHCGAI